MKEKKGFLGIDMVIIIAILIGLVAIVGISYLILSGKIFWFFNQIRNLFRFGN
jgi:hypothetical protein